jgi:Ca-activated chloride channel homolog
MLYRLGLFIPVILFVSFAPFAGTGGTPQEQPKVAITPRKLDSATKVSAANLRLDVKLVLIPVTVTDALDRPVTNLSRESFRVLEDGVEQKITSFSQEDGPVSLGLLFDSSGSMKNRIDSSVEALKLVFRTTIPGDEFFVVQFADQARVLGGFTKDPEEIHRRLGFVAAKGWTALLDAIALSTHHMRNARNQSRVLLILSDGNDNNSRFSESEVRRLVVEGNLRVYGIGLFHWPHFLQQLAQETGGNVLAAQSLSELPDVVQRLSREIRTQYILGYSSTNQVNDGKYRKVKVELLRPSGAPQLRHSWRRGYYASAQ